MDEHNQSRWISSSFSPRSANEGNIAFAMSWNGACINRSIILHVSSCRQHTAGYSNIQNCYLQWESRAYTWHPLSPSALSLLRGWSITISLNADATLQNMFTSVRAIRLPAWWTRKILLNGELMEGCDYLLSFQFPLRRKLWNEKGNDLTENSTEFCRVDGREVRKKWSRQRCTIDEFRLVPR